MEFRKIRRRWGYAHKGFAEALELARRRDKRAALALRRALRSNPASGDAGRARSVLKGMGALEQDAVPWGP